MSFIVPQTDPKASYLAHKDEIDSSIARALCGGQYILGKEVNDFEQEFAAYNGVNHAVGVGNGTDALYLALKACDIGYGDAVITVSHTAVATVAAIELTGATPVFVDIDSITYTMNPECLLSAIKDNKNKIKAIVPVHLYGYPADMRLIMDIAKRYDLYVIEDCAQSTGATLNGRKTGAWGDLAAFSFYPTKNLAALGDGGMVVTSDTKLAEKLYMLRQYGWRKRFISEIVGINTRLDEIQAAILRVNLRYLNRDNAKRKKLAQIYNDSLKSFSLDLPEVKSEVEHSYHQYVVRCRNRDNLLEFLKSKGIQTAIHYPVPVHLQPAYKGRVLVDGDLSHTERICNEILSLPIYPEMTEEQADLVLGNISLWEGIKRV